MMFLCIHKPNVVNRSDHKLLLINPDAFSRYFDCWRG